MLLNGCGGGNHRVLEEVSEQVYAIEPSANITIHNYDGAVLVYGSNINEVRVRSLKRAYTRERLNQITIDVSLLDSNIDCRGTSAIDYLIDLHLTA